jgi:hypothetical protein
MEKQLKCPWCGHERCPDCQNDRWPALRDGCCYCRAKFIEALEDRKSCAGVYLAELDVHRRGESDDHHSINHLYGTHGGGVCLPKKTPLPSAGGRNADMLLPRERWNVCLGELAQDHTNREARRIGLR